jgi:hypothetical protein
MCPSIKNINQYFFLVLYIYTKIMNVCKKSKPIPIPIKGKLNNIIKKVSKQPNCFNLLGDNNFFHNSPPKKEGLNFSNLLKYNISPSSFKKYSLNEYYLKSM